MAVSCVWIIWEAVQRIFYHAVNLQHAMWPALVLVTSIGVDFWRSRQLRAVASALDRLLWQRMPFILPQTSGPLWLSFADWVPTGWVRDSEFRVALR